MAIQLTPAQWKIKQGQTSLILSQPFFGTLALRFKMQARQDLEAGATDGAYFFYNESFINAATQQEVTALLAKAVLHVAHGHVWRRSGRDKQRWNIACAFAVNGILQKAGFTMPPGALINPQWEGWPAEKIYPLIPQQQQGGQGGGKSGSQPGQKPNKQQGKGQHGDTSAKDGGPNWCQVLDPGEEGAEKQEEWEMATVQAATTARQQGQMPAGLERLLDEILKPAADWRSILRRFCQSAAKIDYAWQRPNRRFISRGLYLPSLYTEGMPGLAIGDDTSGSISQDIINVFQNEVTAIMGELNPDFIDVYHCDAKVHSIQRFEAGEVIQFKPKGGGGTDFRPVFKAIEKSDTEPCCLVYFTDCYGDFPATPPSYPVLWACVTDFTAVPFGELVKISL